MGYHTIVIKNIENLSDYLTDWQKLYEMLKMPISYNPSWLMSWLKSYKDETIEIDISFIYDNNNILYAVIPLMIRTIKGNRIIKFLSDSCSDYQGLLFVDEIEKDLSEILVGRFRNLDFTHFEFSNIHENDKSISIIIYSLSNYGIIPKIEQFDRSLSIIINDDYYNNFYSSTVSKRQYKRKIKNLNEQGRISFKIVNSVDDSLLNEVLKIHIDKWNKNNIYPQFSDERRITFINELRKGVLGNILTIFCLYLNETLIAYRFGFVCDSTYYDWNTSFDYNYEKYAPGTVLIIKIIEYLYQIGICKYDFLNGNENYKYVWSNNNTGIFKVKGENIKNKFHLKSYDTPKEKDIRNKKCIILDIHGIILKGSTPIYSTIEGINKLQSIGIKIGVYTNTSAVSASYFCELFKNHGLFIEEKYIMTSAIALKNYLIKKKIKNCYLIGGEPEVPKLLISNNINISTQVKDVEVVVVGFSNKFTYSQLTDAYDAIKNGAEFICCDADLLFVSENNKILPGTGWIVSSISAVCEKEPLIIGKPNDFSLKSLMDTMQVKREETMFIGDNLESDILVGKKAGITTCLQLGGVSQIDEIKKMSSSSRPDFIIDSFEEIVNIFNKK